MLTIPSIPQLNTPKKTKDFVKHLEIISALHNLKLCVPREFKRTITIYRIQLN